MTTEQPQSKIKDFYDNVYYKDARQPIAETRHHKRLAQRMGVKKDMQILDIACGTGEWLNTCKVLGAKIAGVDISDKAIEVCKNTFGEADFYATNAETLPYPNDSFDLVTCLGSLEHFIHPEEALKEMVRASTNEGKVLILVPNSDFLTRKLTNFSGTYQKDAKEEVRSISEWTKLFEDNGLIVEKKWKDLHVLSRRWITLGSAWVWPLRAAQALALAIWPLKWQYQIYFQCSIRPER